MYKIRMTKTFRKNTELCKKRGYDMELLKTAIRLLEADGKLPVRYRAHRLPVTADIPYPPFLSIRVCDPQ